LKNPISFINFKTTKINQKTMAAIDPRVDDYIQKSADFAKPILKHLHNLIHTACPDIKETIKWSFPNFEYKGTILCNMASFKQHCAFNFWLAAKMQDSDKILVPTGEKTSMGNLGQIKSLNDLPKDETMIRYLEEAMELIDKGVKIARAPKNTTAKEVEVPDYFIDALNQNPLAVETFQKFSPSHKREYMEWITEAKTEATRNKRMATAIEWMAEGKGRNWKYAK
jgi:uncharacterized protein YdeI (YjbR/CyaY-like superfamily)